MVVLPLQLATKPRTWLGGKVVHDLCENVGISKRHSSPYHPEGNGQAEWSVQSIKSLIRCVMAEDNLPRYVWPSILQKATFINNTAVNSSTKFSPYELMYGTQPTLPSVTLFVEIFARINFRALCSHENFKFRADLFSCTLDFDYFRAD